MFTKAKISETLKTGIRTVSFRKANGELRLMVCTLQSDYLPPVDPVKAATAAAKPANDEVVVVWDLEAEGWRSFRVDSVISVEDDSTFKLKHVS